MKTDGESPSIAATVGKVLLAALLMLLAVLIADYSGQRPDTQSATPSTTEREAAFRQGEGRGSG